MCESNDYLIGGTNYSLVFTNSMDSRFGCTNENGLNSLILLHRADLCDLDTPKIRWISMFNMRSCFDH
jgi:hypothetical protein